MAMVGVVSGSLYRRTHSLSRLAWSWVGGRLAPFYTFIKWTGWTLAMALPWWQHHKHCLAYYYYYYIKRGEGKGQGKGEGRENLGGAAPQMFFLRTAPGYLFPRPHPLGAFGARRYRFFSFTTRTLRSVFSSAHRFFARPSWTQLCVSVIY